MHLHALLVAALLLSGLQLTSAFVQHAFAYGLLGVDVPPELGLTALPFLSPLVLLAFKRGVGRMGLLGILVGMQLMRIALPFAHGGIGVIVGGAGVAAFLVVLPAYLHRLQGAPVPPIGAGALLGFLAFTALRSVGQGIEPSTRGMGQILGVAVAIAAVGLMWRVSKDEAPAPAAATAMGFGRALLCAIGCMGALSLAYFTFIAPNVVARWSDAPQRWVTLVVAIAGAVCLGVPWSAKTSLRARKWRLVAGAAALGGLLTAAAFMNRIGGPFPSDAPAPFTAFTLPALICWPFAAAAFAHVAGALIDGRPTMRSLAGGFAIASFLAFLLVAVQLLNTLYAYVPVVGPPLRNLYWLGVLLPALTMALPLLAADASPSEPLVGRPRAILLGVAVVLAAIAAIPPWLGATATGRGPGMRIVTFNMQQGYSAAGRENLPAQLDALRALDADVIGLQESDTNRIAGGNEDAVGYFARGLGMHSAYGPSNVAGTFGVALLARHPIENAITKYIDTGEGEQVAILIASVAGVRVAVTHLGNCGRVIETQQIVEIAATADVVMGDFNFTPLGNDPEDPDCSGPNDSYARFIAAGWQDAWRAAHPGHESGNAARIDHVFVRAMKVGEARYLEDHVSDHQALLVAAAK